VAGARDRRRGPLRRRRGEELRVPLRHGKASAAGAKL